MFGSNPLHIYLKFTYICLTDLSVSTVLESFQSAPLFPLTLMHSQHSNPLNVVSQKNSESVSLVVKFGLAEDYFLSARTTITSLLLNHLKSLEQKYSTFQILKASIYEYDALDQMPGEEYIII